MAGYSGYQCQIGKYVSIYYIYELSTSKCENSGTSDIRTPYIHTLQFTGDFIWEQIVYRLFCLFYLKSRVPDPDGLFSTKHSLTINFVSFNRLIR